MTTQEFALNNAIDFIRQNAPISCIIKDEDHIEIPFDHLYDAVWDYYDKLSVLFFKRGWNVFMGVSIIAKPVIIIKSKQF